MKGSSLQWKNHCNERIFTAMEEYTANGRIFTAMKEDLHCNEGSLQ
jgi:hypothetical protein